LGVNGKGTIELLDMMMPFEDPKTLYTINPTKLDLSFQLEDYP